MKAFPHNLLALSLGLITATSFASDSELPYLGHWSNGRGETLTITAKTIAFAKNKPVTYRDISRATDGSDFQLQITTKSDDNWQAGKFLAVHCKSDEMSMVSYASDSDMMQDKDHMSEVTWFKDTDEGGDD